MKPIFFDFMGIKVFSYPLFMGLAWGIAYQLSFFILLEKRESLAGFRGLFWGSFLFSWVGAKLLFLFLSSVGKVASVAGSANFWLGGGFVFFGGLIGGMLFWAIYSVWLKLFPAKKLFLFLPSLTLGHAIGRLGCWFAGCCYGVQCKLPWAISLRGVERHPVQLYEALALFILGFFLLGRIRKGIWSGRKLVAFYLLSYSTIRFLLEFFRGDKLRGIFMGGLSISQLVALGLFMTTSCILLALRKNEARAN